MKANLILWSILMLLSSCKTGNNMNGGPADKESAPRDTIIVYEPASAQTEELFDNDTAIKMLGNFYKAYVGHLLTDDKSEEWFATEKRIIAKYVTEEFLTRCSHDSRLDFNPFTHSQDYFDNWLPTLKITKDESIPYIFDVSMYSWEDSELPHVITVFVKNENNAYKIDDTFNRSVYKVSK